MEIKMIEVRDRATFIPAMAISIEGGDGYLAERAGFGDRMILFTRLVDLETRYDPYAWPNRTMHVAHRYIAEHWDNIRCGQVVDVEFILGETREPKLSEQITAYRYDG